LILHSRLDGYQPNELELIANVARYHRGADPKRKHTNFRQLTARDQDRVRQMAAILRLAGGLDRSNTQQVTDVTVSAGKKDEILLKLTARQFPEVDIWGARKRSKLFEKTFGATLAIEWDPASQAQPGPARPQGNGKPSEKAVPSAQPR
jgi:exopolyphosphatase/guanosine-5'-triphosphate,3'-diphosphate pyrophosphatase